VVHVPSSADDSSSVCQESSVIIIIIMPLWYMFLLEQLIALQFDDGCLLGCCVGKRLPDYTAQQPRRQPSSYSPP
jgi:hypothetical protein